MGSKKSKRFRPGSHKTIEQRIAQSINDRNNGQINAAFDESLLDHSFTAQVSMYSSDFTEADFESKSSTSDTSSIHSSVIHAKIEADLLKTKNEVIEDPEVNKQVKLIETQLKTLSDDISTYTSSGLTTSRTKTDFETDILEEEPYDSHDHSIVNSMMPTNNFQLNSFYKPTENLNSVPLAHVRKSISDRPRQRMQKLSTVKSVTEDDNRPGTPSDFDGNFIDEIDMGLL